MTVTDTATPTALLRTLADWAARLRYDDIPSTTRELAHSQIVSNIAAVRASAQHPLGRRLVAAFGPPDQRDPKNAAFVLAGLSILLDYDEVSYVGHLSTSGVNVAIAYAAELGSSGRDVVTAVIAANECAARVTAATILGPFFRGQTNTHCHLVGAAVALLKARAASHEEWVAGLGLALGILPTPVHDAVLGSDLKALTAASPVRMALDACDAAAAGLTGSATLLDGPDGLLGQLSNVYMPDAVVAGLGERWHTDTLAFKRFPASAYAQAALECAERIHRRTGGIGPSDVTEVRVHGSILTWLLDRKVTSHPDGHTRSVTAANFSLRYGVATVLTCGRLQVADLTSERITDEGRGELASKVVVEHDTELSEAMVRATSPLGQALRQAGPRALDWPELTALGGDDLESRLLALGPVESTFENATMAIGARVEVILVDGTVLTETCDVPTGMTGHTTRRSHRSLVAEKFTGVGGDPATAEKLGALGQLDPTSTADTLRAALGAA
ncbi:MmgE/PrpD family protein [Rhodococcus sp. NPDC003318]|uniref:MmgE/PrpD family protein n=1 Tax=Rhodococcus sp. NPDC003318 TaxID=3364503 RepID=UPI0036A14C75